MPNTLWINVDFPTPDYQKNQSNPCKRRLTTTFPMIKRRNLWGRPISIQVETCETYGSLWLGCNGRWLAEPIKIDQHTLGESHTDCLCTVTTTSICLVLFRYTIEGSEQSTTSRRCLTNILCPLHCACFRCHVNRHRWPRPFACFRAHCS